MATQEGQKGNYTRSRNGQNRKMGMYKVSNNTNCPQYIIQNKNPTFDSEADGEAV